MTTSKVTSSREKSPPLPRLENDRRPLLSATYFQTFRILAREFMPHYLPELADKIANDMRLINNQKSPKYTKKIATSILRKSGAEPALKKLEEENKEAEREEWKEKCQTVLTEYAKAAKKGNAKKKESILAKLEKTRPKRLTHKEILIDAIWRKIDLLSDELRQLKRSPDSLSLLCQEDISPLEDLYARRSANIRREIGGKYLHAALRATTDLGLITITDEKPLDFTINKEAIKSMIKTADSSGYAAVVQLVNCLLIENVAQAQALWNSVSSHSNPKSEVFNKAKEILNTHLERCMANNESWKENPVLNQNFCIKWTNFQLDAPKKPSLRKKLTGKFSNH
jgi:hypothetical protein